MSRYDLNKLFFKAYANVALVLAAALAFTGVAGADEVEDLNKQLSVLRAQIDLETARQQLSALQRAPDVSTIQAQDELVRAETTLKKSKVSQELAEFSAVKEVLGDPPKIGMDGTVSISADDSTVMLQSRDAGISAVEAAAGEVCKRLGDGERNIVPLPDDSFEKIAKARLLKSRIEALIIKSDQYPATVAQSAAAVLAGLQMATYAAGGVGELSKLFRHNQEVTFGSSTRAGLFEGKLGKDCSKRFVRVLVKRLASRKAVAEIEKLGADLEALSIYVAKVASVRKDINAKITSMEAKIATAESKKDTAAIEMLRPRLDRLYEDDIELVKADAVAARASSLLESLAGKEAELVEAANWLAVENELGDYAVMSYTLSVQDVQIKKTGFFTGTRIKYRATAEVVFQVMGKDGAILAAEGISITTSEKKI